MEEIVRRFPDREFAADAAKVLVRFRRGEPACGSARRDALREVELFGLPNLFQVLAESRLTGVLTLANGAGEQIGMVSLEEGKISDCETGPLRGKAAFYQLFEAPVRGGFRFIANAELSKRRTSGRAAPGSAPHGAWRECGATTGVPRSEHLGDGKQPARRRRPRPRLRPGPMKNGASSICGVEEGDGGCHTARARGRARGRSVSRFATSSLTGSRRISPSLARAGWEPCRESLRRSRFSSRTSPRSSSTRA